MTFKHTPGRRWWEEIKHLREQNKEMADVLRTDPYEQALSDVEELLSNSRENGGGIHWGTDFLEGAHWDFELQDQIQLLRDTRNTNGEKE